jgi:hypothetical protein
MANTAQHLAYDSIEKMIKNFFLTIESKFGRKHKLWNIVSTERYTVYGKFKMGKLRSYLFVKFHSQPTLTVNF